MSSPHTGEKTDNQTHTLEPHGKERQDFGKLLDSMGLCVPTFKEKKKSTRTGQRADTSLQQSPPKAPSLLHLCMWWPWHGKQPAVINKARWHTNTHSCVHTCFYCGLLLQPLSNENHMMDHIQLWKPAKNLHPEKTSTNKVLKKHKQKNPRGFRGKAHRGFDPSRSLKSAAAIGWFQLFDIISDGPLVQNKALTLRDV